MNFKAEPSNGLENLKKSSVVGSPVLSFALFSPNSLFFFENHVKMPKIPNFWKPYMFYFSIEGSVSVIKLVNQKRQSI